VTGMEKLLARLKALFGPSPPVSRPPEVPVTSTLPVILPEIAETPAAEPVAAAAERPLAGEPPAITPEAPPIRAEPPPIKEAETDLEPTPADALTLRLETELGSRSMFQVTKSGATIGRGPESTIQLADLSVSRKHARITYRQGAYWLSDLGSMGGTWVDGAKLAAPRRVATGQTIDIGVCRLLVVAGIESEKTGATKGPSNAV
jgi:FHA domain-containing protein